MRISRRFGVLLGVVFVMALASGVIQAQMQDQLCPVVAKMIRSNGTGGGAWSSPATWVRLLPGGGPATPTAADTVVIQPGDAVLLDTNSGIQNLAHLDVRGVLQVQNGQGYDLGVSRVEVANGALFEVGTEAQPFTGRFILNLTSNFLCHEWGNALEHKSFVVEPGGTLDLHGDDASGTKLSWSRLADGQSVVQGATTLTLEADPTWQINDRVVMASTDFEMLQAEELELTMVGVPGSTLGFVNTATGLGATYDHHGVIERGIVDERAEVGLLSHNIVIQGDPATSNDTTRRGGHLMILSDASTPSLARMEWVEFRDMGWHGALGRYPVHFHLAGDMTGSYLENSSIHHAFNRAVTLHGTNNVRVADNVVYDTWGHAYYLEDGSEIGNVFEGNLGLVSREPDPAWAGLTNLGDTWSVTGQPFFSVDEDEPATYWITNPDNTITDNVAAGADGHGFWYHFEIFDPPGPGLPVVPLRFEGNVAHSNGVHGFFQEKARMVTFDATMGNPYDSESVMTDFTAYKNRNAGIWHRAYGGMRWLGAKLADNGFGAYLASEGFQQDYQNYLTISLPTYPYFNFTSLQAPSFSYQILDDCDFIGESGNLGNPSHANELGWLPQPRSLPQPGNPQYMLKGVELYDGFIVALNCRFHDYQDALLPTPVTRVGGTFSWRASGAFSSRGHTSTWVPGNPWGVDSRNMLALCSFTNVDHPVLFPIPHAPSGGKAGNGVESSLVYDVDGSIGPADTYYANNTDLLRPGGYPAPTPLAPLTHYAAPLVVPGPSHAASHAYGQLQLNIGASQSPPDQAWDTSWNVNPATGEMSHVTISALNRPGQSTDVYRPESTPPPYGRYPISLLLDHAAGVEEYAVTYPAGTPALPGNLEVMLKFSEGDRQILLDIPYEHPTPAGPTVEYTNDTIAPAVFAGNAVGSRGAVLAGGALDYHYDHANKLLTLKPTIWAGSGVVSVLNGREIVVFVKE